MPSQLTDGVPAVYHGPASSPANPSPRRLEDAPTDAPPQAPRPAQDALADILETAGFYPLLLPVSERGWFNRTADSDSHVPACLRSHERRTNHVETYAWNARGRTAGDQLPRRDRVCPDHHLPQHPDDHNWIHRQRELHGPLRDRRREG